MVSPVSCARTATSVARRGAIGHGAMHDAPIENAALPLTRMVATALRPGAVAIAAIVSLNATASSGLLDDAFGPLIGNQPLLQERGEILCRVIEVEPGGKLE